MNRKTGSDLFIEQFIKANYDKTSSPREQHNLRQSLYALVRLAKAEQIYELRKDVQKVSTLIQNEHLLTHGKDH